MRNRSEQLREIIPLLNTYLAALRPDAEESARITNESPTAEEVDHAHRVMQALLLADVIEKLCVYYKSLGVCGDVNILLGSILMSIQSTR